MSDKPTRNEQSHRKKNGDDRQPIPPSPPKREKEADAQNNTGNLACDNIKPGENQKRPDDRRPQIARGQSDGAHSSLHMRDTSLVWIQRDRFDSASGAAGGNSMAEFMKRNHQHLSQLVPACRIA